MKIQAKLTSLVVTALVLMGVLVLATTIYQIGQFTQTQIENENQRTQSLVVNLIERQTASIQGYAEGLAENRVLQVALNFNTGDKRGLMTGFYKQLHENDPTVNTVELTDANGIVIMRGHNPDRMGDDKSQDPMVKRALNGESTTSLTVSQTTGEMAIDSIYPIKFNDKVVGTFKVGTYLRQNFAESLKLMSGADIIFITNGKLNQSTIEGLTENDLPQLANAQLNDLFLNKVIIRAPKPN